MNESASPRALYIEPLPNINDGGVAKPWRIEHVMSSARDRGIETFLVWPRMVPDAILSDQALWNQMPEDLRPRRINLYGFINEGGFSYAFSEWWGFNPTMPNFARICAGYYLRVPFDQWGVKVEWA